MSVEKGSRDDRSFLRSGIATAGRFPGVNRQGTSRDCWLLVVGPVAVLLAQAVFVGLSVDEVAALNGQECHCVGLQTSVEGTDDEDGTGRVPRWSP